MQIIEIFEINRIFVFFNNESPTIFVFSVLSNNFRFSKEIYIIIFTILRKFEENKNNIMFDNIKLKFIFSYCVLIFLKILNFVLYQ